MTYELPVTTLGRTGLTVTRLGVGGAYCKTVEGYRAALEKTKDYHKQVDSNRPRSEHQPDYGDGGESKAYGQAVHVSNALGHRTHHQPSGYAHDPHHTEGLGCHGRADPPIGNMGNKMGGNKEKRHKTQEEQSSHTPEGARSEGLGRSESG